MDGVTARYPTADQDVLEGVSVEVERGKTVALVGESGSGKSTLARVITGLLPPEQGQVFYKGETLSADLRDRGKEDLRRIQMIYQMPDVALNPRQRVRDVIGRPLEFYLSMRGKEKAARVAELLEQIELPVDFEGRYPAQLSGGEKQRVCICLLYTSPSPRD